jgi:quinol monooxygenase YgiN
MPATVHVIARYVARPGQEAALKAALTALVAPARREIGCYQFDLLADSNDPRQLCFVERWDDARALDRHLETPRIRAALEHIEELLETPPDVRRLTLV